MRSNFSYAELTADELVVLPAGGFARRILSLAVCKILHWQVVVVAVVAAVVKAEVAAAVAADDWVSSIPLQNVVAVGVGEDEYLIHNRKALHPP